MRTLVAVLALVVLTTPIGSAQAASSVDASGACVESWAPRDMLLGPTAVLNGPILPFRQIAGGAQYAWNNPEWGPWQIAVLGTAAVCFSSAAGVLEGLWWMTTGLADTVTGGAFGLSSKEATTFSVSPQVSPMLADARAAATPTTDPCGRPLATPPAQ